MVGDDNNLIEDDAINNTSVREEVVVNKPKVRKTVVNRQYKSSELIKIAYRLAEENIEIFINSSLQIALSLLVGMLMLAPIIMTRLDIDSFLGISASYNSTSFFDVLFSIFEIIHSGFIMMFTIMTVLFFSYKYIKMWLIIIAIPDINTGIDRIEYKKVKSKNNPSMIIMFGIQLLVNVMFLVLMLNIGISMYKSNGTSIIMLTLALTIIFFIKNYVNFCLFEMFAKGKGLFDALQNASDNLFGSKNNIISKSFDGSLKIGILVFGTLLVVGILDSNIVTSVTTRYAFSYVNIIYITFSVVFMFIAGYLGFVSVIYSYLVYMLNEK